MFYIYQLSNFTGDLIGGLTGIDFGSSFHTNSKVSYTIASDYTENKDISKIALA